MFGWQQYCEICQINVRRNEAIGKLDKMLIRVSRRNCAEDTKKGIVELVMAIALEIDELSD